MIKCENCNCEIELNDNYCYNCGFLTITGYTKLKKEDKLYYNLDKKKNDKLAILFVLMSCFIILFIVFVSISGKSMLKPFIYLKKEIFELKYGYNITLLKNDNQYNNIVVNNIDEAKNIIKQDYEQQIWQCKNNLDVEYIENKLEKNYGIISVNLCDVSSEKAKKVEETFDKIFMIFPNSIGYLTNISMSNSSKIDDYIAYFQPIYQFVNSNSQGNKVNKTQILLNSYYYLDDIRQINVENYVDGATLDTILAHELGHYIFFVSLLKQYNINILMITDDNKEKFNEILNLINSGKYAKMIIEEALDNYNKKYSKIDIETYAINISKYAASKNDYGIIFEETIAEAIHDYYINGNNSKKESLEIINVLKERLNYEMS